jgi:hypothetical protein
MGLKPSAKLLTAAASVAAAVLAIAACPAQAAQRVADGNFEATTCTTTDCTSPAWMAVRGGAGFAIGPLCGPLPTACQAQGSGYTSAFHWARLGASGSYAGIDRAPAVTSSISQSVLIPAAPATLSFALRIIDDKHSTGSFAASIDGQGVYGASDTTVDHINYELVTVNVGRFAGPGPKTLKFEATEQPNGNMDDASPYFTDSFDVDDVSLDAADPAAGVAGAVAGSGQRAAALAKCKKKHGKKKRKCRKKANLLPV